MGGFGDAFETGWVHGEGDETGRVGFFTRGFFGGDGLTALTMFRVYRNGHKKSRMFIKFGRTFAQIHIFAAKLVDFLSQIDAFSSNLGAF